jgi:uncharacterized membrane protein
MTTDTSLPVGAMTCRAWRLLTPSDGVVAIALTLLVLQLEVPPHVHVANPSSAATSRRSWRRRPIS